MRYTKPKTRVITPAAVRVNAPVSIFLRLMIPTPFILMGALPPNPRRYVGQSPTPLPSGNRLSRFSYLMGTLPPNPRRYVGQSPTPLPSGNRLSRFSYLMGTLPPNPRRYVGQSPTPLPSGGNGAAFFIKFVYVYEKIFVTMQPTLNYVVYISEGNLIKEQNNMSRTWKILENIGEIDDKFVLESNELPNKAQNRLVGLMPLAIACLAMTFVFVFFLTRENNTSPAIDMAEWANLPILPVPDTVVWSGWQTTRAYDSNELISDNPWLSLTEPVLPVFRNPVNLSEQTLDYTEEFLIETIEAIANYFDITIAHINIRNISLTNDFSAPMGFKNSGDTLSRWFEVFDEIGVLRLTLDIFRGEVSILFFDNPVPLSDIEYPFVNSPFDVDWGEDGNINDVLGYTFCRTGFLFTNESRIYTSCGRIIVPDYETIDNSNERTISSIHITLPNMLLSQHIGYYPIITPEEALEQLLQGNYISTFHYTYWPGEELARNAHVELVYRNFELDYVFMPYYLFKIAIPEWHGVADFYEEHGIMTYGWWWVPAVRSEFLYNWGNN